MYSMVRSPVYSNTLSSVDLGGACSTPIWGASPGGSLSVASVCVYSPSHVGFACTIPPKATHPRSSIQPQDFIKTILTLQERTKGRTAPPFLGRVKRDLVPKFARGLGDCLIPLLHFPPDQPPSHQWRLQRGAPRKGAPKLVRSLVAEN